jgi:zinc/manganese transport system substrate-binding protein
MNRRFFFIAAATLAGPLLSASAALKVGATHPLVGNLVRQVGGNRVTVVDLLRPGDDPHRFEPAASELNALRGATAVFASGKRLEPYLGKLGDSLGPGVRIIEVGRPIPSLKVSPGNEVFLCCPAHASGGIDPHWWHSAENMARAARGVAVELAKLDPAGAAEYKAGGEATAKRMQGLKTWAKQQFAAIPRADRKLVTAHAAFGYFCKEYGFKFVPLLGIAGEQDYSPQYIAQAIRVIRDEKIRAVFPEDQANPKVLAEIVRETGIKVGGELISDGTAPGAGSTFEGMLRHNVAAIVAALRPGAGS